MCIRDSAMRDIAVRICIECRGQLLDTIECHCVVARGDVDVLAACSANTGVPTPWRSLTWTLPGTHARFTSGHFEDVFPRPIGRIAVVNEQLPVGKGLLENRSKSLGQKRTRVQVRHADRHAVSYTHLRAHE